MDFPAQPPYYAVIFTAQRTSEDDAGYAAMAERMEDLARRQPGYLGIESTRDAQGQGITVSYWQSLEALHEWGKNIEHRVAQARGKAKWYERFHLRICRVEREWHFERDHPAQGERHGQTIDR
jgi:heme-degrading monooxygenase HmoA